MADCDTRCKEPLSNLAPCGAAGGAAESSQGGSLTWLWILLCFIVLALIVAGILYAWKPTWVQYYNAAGQPTGQVNGGLVFVWSIVVALIITFIIWALVAACNAGKRQ